MGAALLNIWLDIYFLSDTNISSLYTGNAAKLSKLIVYYIYENEAIYGCTELK